MSARSFVLNKRRQGNITIIKDNVSLSCRLHNTIICRMTGNQIQLHSGGWKTVTTKTAINRFLELNEFDHYIYQDKFQWFIRNRETGLTYEYHDGMIIIRSGTRDAA